MRQPLCEFRRAAPDGDLDIGCRAGLDGDDDVVDLEPAELRPDDVGAGTGKGDGCRRRTLPEDFAAALEDDVRGDGALRSGALDQLRLDGECLTHTHRT